MRSALDADGLREGCQIGPDWGESTQTAPGEALEQRTDWCTGRPGCRRAVGRAVPVVLSVPPKGRATGASRPCGAQCSWRRWRSRDLFWGFEDRHGCDIWVFAVEFPIADAGHVMREIDDTRSEKAARRLRMQTER